MTQLDRDAYELSNLSQSILSLFLMFNVEIKTANRANLRVFN